MVMMMVGVATTPVPIACPAVMMVPPTRVISPIVRTAPCVPTGAPEPIVYYRTIDVNGLDDVVGAIYILVAYYLNGNLVLLVFLYIDGRYILIDVFREDSLQHDEPLVAFAGLYDTQVIHFAVSVEIEVTERAVGVVEQVLELLQVLCLSEQFRYHLQIQTFGYIRTVG